MLSLICLAAIVCLASAQTCSVDPVHHATKTDTNIVPQTGADLRYYLGKGRVAKISCLQPHVGGCQREVSIDYFHVGDESRANCTYNENTQLCEISTTANQHGLPLRCENPKGTKLCIAISASNYNTNEVKEFVSDAIDLASVSRTRPYFFKSHGTDEYHFFLRVKYTQCTAAQPAVPISFTARAYGLDENDHCVTPEHTKFQMVSGPAPDLEGEAALPRHFGFQYRTSSKTIPGVNPYNARYWDLGVSPIIELSCVHIHTAPVNKTNTCAGAQYGTDGVPNLNAPAAQPQEQVGMYLVEALDCSAWTAREDGPNLAALQGGENYTKCCGMTTEETCNALREVNTNEKSCFWAEDTCFPTYRMGKTSLKGIIGLNATRSFQSFGVHTPESSAINLEDQVTSGWEGPMNRRWFLAVENEYGNECPLVATVSYISRGSGGECEPSGRAMCERRAAKCFTGVYQDPQNVQLWWHRLEENPQAKDDFRPCNCLKEKEVCYRNIGCGHEKRHQLILQNCLDQSCGNFCNSAGALSSWLATVVAALTLVLLL